MDIQQIEDTSRVAIAGGSSVTMFAWLSDNADAITSLAGIVGMLVAVIGLFVNWYYLHRKSKSVRK